MDVILCIFYNFLFLNKLLVLMSRNEDIKDIEFYLISFSYSLPLAQGHAVLPQVFSS